MPNILNSAYDGPTGCNSMSVKGCEDNSVYFNDASLLVDVVDTRKLKKAVSIQIHKVAEAAQSDGITVDELLQEIDRLRDITRVFATFDRLTNK